MISFLRKFRQKLISEKKLSKYLLYAIGEIILVVIGILIALQINNWNGNRVKIETEKELLASLQTDFLETEERLNATIERQEEVIFFSQTLIELYESNKLMDHFESVPDYVCFGALSWWRAEPVTGTFDAMLSTGNIELIRNDELRRYLTQFDAELKSGFEDHEYSMDLLTLLTTQQSDYLLELYSARARKDMGLENPQRPNQSKDELEKLVKRLEGNVRFFGLLTNKLVMDQNRLERQKKLKSFSINILNQIQDELK